MHKLGAVISSVHATRLSSFSEGAQSAWMARHSFSPWLASHFHSYINQESWINNESLSPMYRMKRLLDTPSHLIESWPREKCVSILVIPLIMSTKPLNNTGSFRHMGESLLVSANPQ